MKARTKLQLRVTELSKALPKITRDQEKWAYQNCLPHLGYANKSSAFCLDCGKTFPIELISRKKATCPHCKGKLKIEPTRKTTDKFVGYFSIAHVVEEFQVAEYFEVWGYYKKGQPARIYLHAILEDWILPDSKVTKIGLQHNLNWNCDSWTGDWAIRDMGYLRKYEVYPRHYHPDSKFRPELKKIGINKNLKGLTLLEAIKLIPYSSKAETLLKAKEYDLLEYLVDHLYLLDRFWPSIKIAMRNRYKIKDVRNWFDYLYLLVYFGKDLHNAKYVCPTDLNKEHDRLVAKRAEKERREELEQRRKDIEEAEVSFKKRMKKFFKLHFSEGDIVIKVLTSVKEFEEEGDILKHCLFTNEYYAKEESLILSARIDNVPIETIEVNLPKLKIEQSRGLGNKPSEHNKKIVSLVKRNLPQIGKLLSKKTA
jgi:DNA-directed RNA polymerase subunit RPC12/RpoP